MRSLFLFRCFRQEWLLILLTTVLILLTALQANGSVLTKNIPLVSHSGSYSIFFLRVISELAGLSLAATLAVTLEQVKWAIVTIGSGGELTEASRAARLVEFLALDIGTTIPGLLRLLVSPSISSLKARLWSLGRLITMIVVPVTGVLIMSKVDVYPVFISVKETVSGFGSHEMNITAAREYAGFTDIILGSKFGSFVQSPTRSIELTPESVRSKLCGLNAVPNQDPSDCTREYFIPGEAVFAMPEALLDPSNPEADILLVENHQAHNLRYGVADPGVSFDLKNDCRLYYGRYWSYNLGGFLLCMVNTSPNTVQAKLTKCPETLTLTNKCLATTDWQLETSWTLLMNSSLRTGTVAYSRLNASILSYNFPASSPDPVPMPISAADMLLVYDKLFEDTTLWNHTADTPLPAFSGTSLVTVLYLTVPYFSVDNAKNPMVASNLFAIFQSLLALPLYYSQSGMMRRLIPPRLTTSFIEAGFDKYLSPLPERTSKVSLANQQFETVAEKGTLIAYVVIGGASVVFCVCVQVVLGVMMVRRGVGGRLPDLTSFGALDLFTHCVMESMQAVASAGDRKEGERGGVFGEWFEGFAKRRETALVEEGRSGLVVHVNGSYASSQGSEFALAEASPVFPYGQILSHGVPRSEESLSGPERRHYWGVAL